MKTKFQGILFVGLILFLTVPVLSSPEGNKVFTDPILIGTEDMVATVRPRFTPTPFRTPTPTARLKLTSTMTSTPTATVSVSSWEEVGVGSASGGGISNNIGGSDIPSVAVGANGVPFVAWQDYSNGVEIYVRSWDGINWVEVGAGSANGGGISNNVTNSYGPSVAIAPDGTAYIAWTDIGSFHSDVYIRRWNGSIWDEVGVGSASGGGISINAGSSFLGSLAIAPDGIPWVTWTDGNSGDFEIYVRCWDGSSWVEVGASSASGGGISNNAGWAGAPSLAFSPNGTPYIAWYDDSNGNQEIYVRSWDGNNWVEVGTGSASGGGISNNIEYSQLPSIAISPDGTPYIAWSNGTSGNGEIYIRHWDGSSWAEVGTGSASGGGISNNAGSSGGASLAITSDGTPCVAWHDSSNGNSEVYIRCWDGNSWVEVGTGSASGGGISNNASGSDAPSLAIALDGTLYVAWDDDSNGDAEIYIRRFIE